MIVGSSFKEGTDGQDAQQHQGPGARLRRPHRQSCSGRSTRFRGPASSATRRGRTTRGRSTATPACGRGSPSTKRPGSSTCRSKTPTSDLYGGHRPGNNLFADTLVCVDLKTGQRKWHFQVVHHPIWDYDLSSAPILADINVNGTRRSRRWRCRARRRSFTCSIASPVSRSGRSKSVRCRRGDVPGERTSPTQPFPTKPPAYARQAV